MKPRILTRALLKAVKTFPAVVVTGPRQSGKTTLLKAIFSKTHRFITLENPDVRIRAKEDPVGFLEENTPPLILDEIQYAPELLSYIKTKIDERRKPGQWLFTGSQNFTLMQGVSQSLAGRTAALSLLPFSFSERVDQGNQAKDTAALLNALPLLPASHVPASLGEVILRGHYPEIASKRSVDRQLWCGSYLSTYLERDVRNLAQIGDLSQFERFLKLCATRTGQLLNLSEMARDIGVSVPTAKRWLSVLETGYQVYLLYPYYKNLGKRLVKSPKLYFNDTALATYLLGLQNQETLVKSPSFGALFETLIVTDFLKRFLHFGQLPSMYYLKTRDGLEIDLVMEINQRLHLFEIKSTMTLLPKHAASLFRITDEQGRFVKSAGIVFPGKAGFKLKQNISAYGWRRLLAN